MLYDKKWDAKVETKADPFSLESLIAWLEKQPKDKVYCYVDNGHCLIAQYLLSLGYQAVGVDARGFYDRSDDSLNTANLISLHPNLNTVAVREPYTFGAALERGRKLLAHR